MIRRTPLKRSTKPLPKRRTKPRRGPTGIPAAEWRNPAYRRFIVAEGLCVACARNALRNVERWPILAMCRPLKGACDPAHTENNGMRSKGRDSSCAPLCRVHHREYDSGRVAFEQLYGLDMQREAAIWWKSFGTWKESQ